MCCTKFGNTISSLLVVFILTTTVVAATAIVQDEDSRTLDEFKKYLSEKIDTLSDSQLEKIAERVDADGDGNIAESEFNKRMQAIRAVMTAGETDEDQPKAADDSDKQDKQDKPDLSDDEDDESESSDDSKAEEPAEKNVVMEAIAAIDVVEIPALVKSNDAAVLLITADELAEAWVPFAKWKTKNGKLTKIITVGQINRDFEANSIQEKIRLCVRQHIDNHKTRWVMLGGDCLPGGTGGLVPGGHTTVHSMEPKGIPTDIVYLSPTDWDADDDGVYGEFDDDREAITYPDGTVGLGRVPVRTAEDIQAFTDKVIAYESNYPTDEFAANMIYTCTDKPAYPKVRNSWDEYVSKVWNGEAGRFFADETPWDEEDKPGSHALSADNLVTLINDSTVGKLHIHGHGLLPLWVLEKSRFTEKHVKQLTNDGAYPLITTVSCNTGEYDSKKDPSIVEQMIRAPRAGSVAIVAPVRTGKAHFAKRSDFRLMITEGKLDGTTMTMTSYWKFGLGDAASTGHAFMQAKDEMAEDAVAAAGYHLCVCELNLLGDPTLDMRAEAPRSPTIESEIKNAGTQWDISISTDAPGATVCLWNGKDVYRVATADEKGQVDFTAPSLDGAFEATVSGSSLNSVSKTVSVGK